MSKRLAKAHEEFSNRKKAQGDAKEDIVNQIGLILRSQRGLSTAQCDLENDPSHKLTLQHLRDFLTYLEDKSIINCETLARDDNEMKNLINDLVKLDFNKFQVPINTSSVVQNKRLSQGEGNRRASLD